MGPGIRAGGRSTFRGSPREMKLPLFLGQGRSNKKIDHILSITPQTVKNRVTSILRKLDIKDSSQASPGPPSMARQLNGVANQEDVSCGLLRGIPIPLMTAAAATVKMMPSPMLIQGM